MLRETVKQIVLSHKKYFVLHKTFVLKHFSRMYLISLRTFIFYKIVDIVLSSSISFEQCGNNDTIFLAAKEIRVETMLGVNVWSELFKNQNEKGCRSLCHIKTRCRSAIFNLQNQTCLLQEINRFSSNIKIKRASGVKFYDKTTCRVSEGGFIGLVADAVDCKDIRDKGWRSNGVYGIPVAGEDDTYQTISCEMSLLGGGWTVIQRRIDGSVDFDENWSRYKQGFGDLGQNFWYGNERIHKLTWWSKNDILFELHLPDGRTFYPMYDEFKVDNGDNRYTLTVGNRVETNHGDAVDYTTHPNLEYHNQKPFSTKDTPNSDCSKTYFGGWWFDSCHTVYLNGKYGKNDVSGILWDSITESPSTTSLKYASMMIRKK